MINQIQVYYRTIKINEEEHEVNRTSADEDQIDDVTFLETPLIPTRSKEEAIMKVEIRKKIVRKLKKITQRKEGD